MGLAHTAPQSAERTARILSLREVTRFLVLFWKSPGFRAWMIALLSVTRLTNISSVFRGDLVQGQTRMKMKVPPELSPEKRDVLGQVQLMFGLG